MQGCLVIQNKNLSYQFGKLGLLLCFTDTLLVSCFLLMLLVLKLLGQQQLQQGRRGLEEVGDQGRYPQFLCSAVLAPSWHRGAQSHSGRSEHVALCFLLLGAVSFPVSNRSVCLLSLLGNCILCKWAFAGGPQAAAH